MEKLLICDDDSLIHEMVRHILRDQPYSISVASSVPEALQIYSRQAFTALLLDVDIGADDGISSIKKFKAIAPEIPVVILSGHREFPVIQRALREGAEDYVAKDSAPEEILHVLKRVIETRQYRKESAQRQFEERALQASNSLIGKSSTIQQLRKTIDKIRKNPSNVLITGETGTGKEVVARLLRTSPPGDKPEFNPFVAIDSATIQSSMAESILFGYEKGAFTGADKTQKGLFEEADGGIVYFDEIANMPLEIQAKLLRVLQEKEVCRLGSTRVLPLSFRVVAASNRNLEAMISEKTFKDDLYQRLAVIPLTLPPLRERAEDIPELAEHFLSQQNKSLQTHYQFSVESLALLTAYSWPGNVRELANTIAYVTAMAEKPTITPADLPPKILKTTALPEITPSGNFYSQVGAFEKSILEREYKLHDGNVTKMATKLGMDRSHLYTKLKEFGLHSAKKT